MQYLPWPSPLGYRDIKLGLTRVAQFLNLIGNPERKLPPVIHVTGTNGKGSTVAFMRAILESAGYSVHVYTSPHLVNFNERIVLASQEISDEFLTEILNYCQKVAAQNPQIELTFFEGLTVSAFLAFAQTKADILLLEVGLGGRLDATNIITESLVSVITPISNDHSEFLGDTLSKIAIEKCGIIKPNSRVVVGRHTEEVLGVIRSEAAKRPNLKTSFFGEDFRLAPLADGGFNYSEPTLEATKMPKPALLGAHQIDNAALAIAVLRAQNQLPLKPKHFKEGIEQVSWPARLQKITSGKFAKLLPKNFELIVDGSHNQAGAETLAAFIESEPAKKIYLIFAMLKGKDCAQFLKQLSGKIAHLTALEVEDEPRTLAPKEIVTIAQATGISASIGANFSEAIRHAINLHNSAAPAQIIICGSLYQAGNFLRESF